MDIESIPKSYAGGLDLRGLEVLEVLLREQSLTRAAKVLDVTQPALSKTLARLRRYFSDPLFVRAGLRMEPTAKALDLAGSIGAILERVRALRSEHVAFDPATSSRTFNFCVVDAGVIKLLPPLVNLLMEQAPRIRLRTIALDARELEPWLASGNIDFAMGSFPGLTKSVRRQFLWTETYVSVVRNGHPRLGRRPSAAAFAAEKHVLVSTVGTGHAHQHAERALERAVARENIVCRVPMFIGAAVLAKHTDAVATLPRSIATVLARDLDLAIIRPPIRLPTIDIHQYWHDRFHREPGSQWIRSVFASLFRDR
jgi:DNA-binding transcriptional LysR family regulator